MKYQIRRISLPKGEWTPIIACSACNYFSFKSESGSELLQRSDEDDDETECTLRQFEQDVVIAPVNRNSTPRWGSGDLRFYVKPVNDMDEVGILKVIL